jgi:hypothetical protein
VAASEIKRDFGFALFTRAGAGWNLTVKNPQGATVAAGRIDGRHLTPAR